MEILKLFRWRKRKVNAQSVDLGNTFDEYSLGSDQANRLMTSVNWYNLLNGRHIFSCDVRPGKDHINIPAVIDGPEFFRDWSDETQASWVAAIADAYSKLPDAFEREIRVNLESLAYIERKWGCFADYYR